MKIRFNLVKYLANLKLAIFLLLTIAAISIIGSVIEQNQPSQFYLLNYAEPVFGIINGKVLIWFGLDHVFQTWWFITLLLLFGLSLTCCTFLQQLPALERVQKIKFYTKSAVLNRFPVNTRAPFVPLGKYIFLLRQKRYKIFQSGKSLYANKGLIGRISPIVVHFSMVLILLGTIFASTSGFVSQEFIPETEIFYVQNILNHNINTFIPQISGRVNDFWISYKTDLTVKQFYTDLSLLDKNGKEIKRETIFVNHPLKYKGLTFYQTDWNVVGFRIQINEKIYQLPAIKKDKDIYISWLPTNIDNVSSSPGYILVNLADRDIGFLYDQKSGQLLNKIETNEPFNNLCFLGLIEATGIQIKADPGLVLIYFGFFLLIISIFTSYISFSQVWLVLDPKQRNMNIIGTSNRSKLTFEFEIFNFLLKL